MKAVTRRLRGALTANISPIKRAILSIAVQARMISTVYPLSANHIPGFQVCRNLEILENPGDLRGDSSDNPGI